jgi:hypothetical protein
MDITMAPHATVATIVKFNTPVYVAIIPVVLRLIKQAAFMIVS